MANHYRSQGFILLKEDLREADQIFNIYTKDFGKLKILGKAIRKIKSKLRSGMELFYLSEIEFIQGKNYKTLTDALLIDKFKNIKTDLAKLETAYKITEVTDDLIRGQEADERIWNLLNQVFSALNDCSLFIFRCSLIYYYFLWNLFSILGYQIDFYNCVVCGKKLLPKNLYFSAEQNGIICCSTRDVKHIEISPELVKILRILTKGDWQTVLRLKISFQQKEELELFSEKYLFLIKDNICYNK